jgi:hypothetical protein
LAQQWNCTYIETSAKENQNVCKLRKYWHLSRLSLITVVAEIFDVLVAQIEKTDGPEKEEKPCIIS